MRDLTFGAKIALTTLALLFFGLFLVVWPISINNYRQESPHCLPLLCNHTEIVDNVCNFTIISQLINNQIFTTTFGLFECDTPSPIVCYYDETSFWGPTISTDPNDCFWHYQYNQDMNSSDGIWIWIGGLVFVILLAGYIYILVQLYNQYF